MGGAKGATMTWATDRTGEGTRNRIGAAMGALRNAGRALGAGAGGRLARPRVRRVALVILEVIGVVLLVAAAQVVALWLLVG